MPGFSSFIVIRPTSERREREKKHLHLSYIPHIARVIIDIRLWIRAVKQNAYPRATLRDALTMG